MELVHSGENITGGETFPASCLPEVRAPADRSLVRLRATPSGRTQRPGTDITHPDWHMPVRADESPGTPQRTLGESERRRAESIGKWDPSRFGLPHWICLQVHSRGTTRGSHTSAFPAVMCQEAGHQQLHGDLQKVIYFNKYTTLQERPTTPPHDPRVEGGVSQDR